MRTDIHRPSAINPGDYDYVGIWYDPSESEVVGGSLLLRMERDDIEAHMRRTGGRWASHSHGGTCFCCGAMALYLAVFHHPGTNEYIQVGERCTEKLGKEFDQEFRSVRTAVQLSKESIAKRNRISEFLSANNLQKAQEIYEQNQNWDTFEEKTIVDIMGKLMRWGAISPKQLEFLKTLIYRVENRAAVEAERAAEKASAQDCPSGRVDIVGTVVSTREVDGQYGTVLKMFLKTAEGYTLWGTVPKGLMVEKGQEVSFRATVEPSHTDPKHGFFSRPKVLGSSQSAGSPAQKA